MKLKPKDIPGYEGRYYLDPNRMQVVNSKSGRSKKTRLDPEGYPEVQLWKNNHGEHKTMHRMFAEAYIPNPHNFPEVNHIDEDKTNYSLDNLEWCTHRYNMKYGTCNERRGQNISKALKGRPGNPNSGKKPVPVIGYNDEGIECYYPSGHDADRQLGLSRGSIADVLCGRRKSAGGYKWRKANQDEIR